MGYQTTHDEAHQSVAEQIFTNLRIPATLGH